MNPGYFLLLKIFSKKHPHILCFEKRFEGKSKKKHVSVKHLGSKVKIYNFYNRCYGNRWGHLIVRCIIEDHLAGQLWGGLVEGIVIAPYYLSKYERLISSRFRVASRVLLPYITDTSTLRLYDITGGIVLFK